jgi:nitrate reductase NapE component
MSKLKRLNDWCGEVMDKVIRNDDLITFVFFAIMVGMLLTILIVATLGVLGFLK